MQSKKRYLFIFTVLLITVVGLVTSSGAAETPAQGEIVPGRYIVQLANGVSPAAFAGEYGLATRHQYHAALTGFAANIPDAVLSRLQADSRVLAIEPDRVHHILVQDKPTGIDRIEADKNPNANGVTVNLDVAIVDTGIDADHADLNAAGGRNFTFFGGVNDWDDSNGHGTHVAGTVGALDNNIGVVGVAPGVRVWAFKVCNPLGSCFTSDIAAGIDAVTACKNVALGRGGTCALRSGGINFAVANMSISTSDDANPCPDSGDSVHTAICNVVNAGVVFSLSAGNDNRNKSAYPEAFAVSALADFDGRGGGAGESTCRTDEDDSLADFSNFGSTVDIAAPGTCILSTWNDGGYNTISGTSMASPHVTGAVALYLHANDQAPAQNAAGVDAIEQAIIDAALPEGTENDACSYDNEFGSHEPLLFVNGPAFGGNGSCDVAGGPAPTPTNTPVPGDTPTPTASPVPTNTPTNTPVPSGTMHVGDLDGTGISRGSFWSADVTVTVHDDGHRAVSNATVSGSWSTGFGGSTSCTTNSSGQCTVSRSFVSNNQSSVTFTVNNVTHSTLTYQSGDNHDPDGDSNGTSVTVSRP